MFHSKRSITLAEREKPVALADKTSAAYMRTPSWIQRKTIAHSELNIGTRWRGVKGNQVDVVTCGIKFPRNQLSVEMEIFPYSN